MDKTLDVISEARGAFQIGLPAMHLLHIPAKAGLNVSLRYAKEAFEAEIFRLVFIRVLLISKPYTKLSRGFRYTTKRRRKMRRRSDVAV